MATRRLSPVGARHLERIKVRPSLAPLGEQLDRRRIERFTFVAGKQAERPQLLAGFSGKE
jgi:hypothetical protein